MTPSLPHNGDHKDYHLTVIRETAAELGHTRHPGRILASFLMSAQGGLGALGGFAALTDRASEITHLIVRGDEKISHEQIKSLIKTAAAKPEPSAFFISMDRALPRGFALILACPLEDDRLAFLGLAPPCTAGTMIRMT
nr:hypothetical protein [Desulfobacula sp.]